MAITMPGTWEFVFLGILALLVFGPERLPEIARNIGKAVSTLRREASSTMDELKRAADAEGFSQVAHDLRQTTTDLQRSASLTGPVASSASPAAAQSEPAPFDPDAT